MPAPHADLSRLEPFVGTWKTSGRARAGSGPDLELHGTDSYAWLAGGHFLVHKARVSLGGRYGETLELIGRDAASQDGDSFFMRFFDSDGQSGEMRAGADGARWIFTGEGLRFEGGFGADGRSFSGTWSRRDGDAWAPWMTLRLERA